MKFLINQKIFLFILALIAICTSYFFDKPLALGLALLLLLFLATLFIFQKINISESRVYWLFCISMALHLCTALFMHYADFQPFSGHNGDYVLYQKLAIGASEYFKQGIFSLKDISIQRPDLQIGHYYPVIIGLVYAMTLPEKFIGLMLNVWFASLSIVFLYLIILEIGGSKRSAFLIGIIANLYPSYIFVTGLLLKEAIEVMLIFAALLFLIKTIKNFSWTGFIIMYFAIIGATHFRFYMGYALMLTFFLSWFFLVKINLKKRLIYGILFIVLLGLIPQVAAGQGYCGINTFVNFLNPKIVTFYRQIAYIPADRESLGEPGGGGADVAEAMGMSSSFKAENNILGYFKSFLYVLLGPFPWSIKSIRQASSLVEMIPWYFILFFVSKGVISMYKNHNKEALSLLIFSFIVMVVMAIFNSNFGIIIRIRIPAFLALLCIAALGFNENNKIYEKIYSYWRGWLHSKPLN